MPDEMPLDETEVNMVSVIARVIGFHLQSEGQPPIPAENARDADLLMFNWIVSNTTDEEITWHFPTSSLYRLQLLMLGEEGWEAVWTKPDDSADDDETVIVVPHKGTYSIPPDGDSDEGDDEQQEKIEEEPPTISLKEICEDLGIPSEVELAVEFELKAIEFPQQTLIPLWR